MFATRSAVFTSWLGRRLVLMPCHISFPQTSLEPSVHHPRISSCAFCASGSPLLHGLCHCTYQRLYWRLGHFWRKVWHHYEVSTWPWLCPGFDPLLSLSLSLANRSSRVRASIFSASRSSMEIVSGNPVMKASLVSLSISAPLNPANPINCLILFTKMFMRLLAHLTMVSFLYAVNASSVKASFSRALICSASLGLVFSISM